MLVLDMENAYYGASVSNGPVYLGRYKNKQQARELNPGYTYILGELEYERYRRVSCSNLFRLQ